uniref:Uncharacterized protein n=1 Tax=Anopheles farauti TaxID=69004 RepID=A0A182QB84_9DIPT
MNFWYYGLVVFRLCMEFGTGTCWLQVPPCTLRNWKGKPVRQPFEINGDVNYLRYDTAVYTPFSDFSTTRVKLELLKAYVLYGNRQLTIIVYCWNGIVGQSLTDLLPTDPESVRLFNMWSNCRTASYRVQYNKDHNILYLMGSLVLENGRKSEMFLALNQWQDDDIQRMDKQFNSSYLFRLNLGEACTLRSELTVHFDLSRNGGMNIENLCTVSQSPSCIFHTFKGKPIKQRFDVDGQLTYLRYAQPNYNPLRAFNPASHAHNCAKARVSYAHGRLNVSIYCKDDTASLPSYNESLPTDPALLRLANVWKNCRRTKYVMHYDRKQSVLYLTAGVCRQNNWVSEVFLTINQWTTTYIPLYLPFGRCYTMVQRPPCPLLDWNEEPIREDFQLQTTISYFRLEASVYSPFDVFTQRNRGFDCINANISYIGGRLELVLYCNITAGQNYSVPSVDWERISSTDLPWKNCRQTTYWIHYDPTLEVMFFRASIIEDAHRNGDMFLAGNEWTQKNVRAKDPKYAADHMLQPRRQCNCTERAQLSIMFDVMDSGGNCNISQKKPPCALLDWNGKPIRKDFQLHTSITYFRLDSSIFTPFSTFTGFDCINANISYIGGRLELVLYCKITSNQKYKPVLPVDEDLARLTNRWKNCHQTAYRILYHPSPEFMYFNAHVIKNTERNGEIFLAGNDLLPENIRTMDSRFASSAIVSGVVVEGSVHVFIDKTDGLQLKVNGDMDPMQETVSTCHGAGAW